MDRAEEAHGSIPGRRRRRLKEIAAVSILLTGVVAPLLVPMYDRRQPALLGFPFFYWYQLAWVVAEAGVCGLAYVLLRRRPSRSVRGRRSL